MTRPLRIQWALAIALLAAVATAGYLTAPTADAQSQTFQLRIQPGTDAGTADMTCGWHSTCPAGSGGVALDWFNNKFAYDGGKTVHFRSWASYSAGPPSMAMKASATNVNPDDFCKYVDVEIRRPTSGTVLAHEHYTHVGHAISGTFTVNAGSSPTFTIRRIGTTLHYPWEDDSDDCPPAGNPSPGWTASHLHQGQGAGPTTLAKNGLYPNSGDPINFKNDVDVNSQSWWLNLVNISY